MSYMEMAAWQSKAALQNAYESLPQEEKLAPHAQLEARLNDDSTAAFWGKLKPDYLKVSLQDSGKETTQADANMLYAHLDMLIHDAAEQARNEGKQLVVLVGEEHTDRVSLMTAYMVQDIAVRQGISRFAYEMDEREAPEIENFVRTFKGEVAPNLNMQGVPGSNVFYLGQQLDEHEITPIAGDPNKLQAEELLNNRIGQAQAFHAKREKGYDDEQGHHPGIEETLRGDGTPVVGVYGRAHLHIHQSLEEQGCHCLAITTGHARNLYNHAMQERDAVYFQTEEYPYTTQSPDVHFPLLPGRGVYTSEKAIAMAQAAALEFEMAQAVGPLAQTDVPALETEAAPGFAERIRQTPKGGRERP